MIVALWRLIDPGRITGSPWLPTRLSMEAKSRSKVQLAPLRIAQGSGFSRRTAQMSVHRSK